MRERAGDICDIYPMIGGDVIVVPFHNEYQNYQKYKTYEPRNVPTPEAVFVQLELALPLESVDEVLDFAENDR
jgi:hypothetical protein